MTDTQVLVHVDLGGVPVPAGRLWTRVRRGKESASFEYDPRWLEHPGRFSLEPALTRPGPFHMASAFEHDDLAAAAGRPG